VNTVKDFHEAALSQQFLFHFIDIDCISLALLESYPFISTSQHTLLLFINGSGTLSINDMPYLVTKGKCFLIQPHSSFDFLDMDDHSMFYKVSFQAFQLVENVPVVFHEHLFSNQVAYYIFPFIRCMQLVEELYRNRCKKDSLNQQARLYELLNIVSEQQIQINQSFNPTKAVEQTIEYIHAYYQKSVTVKGLAELAQVPQWQYSEIFQALTGKRPLDYVTDLRLQNAKELLQQTEQAKNWLTRFKLKENRMWQQLQRVINPGDTASVFMFDRGQRLFVMGCTGLSPALYHPIGFQPQKRVKSLIQEEIGYQEISIELLPEYAGDHIFLLWPDNPEFQLATKELLNHTLWKSLPAVRKNRYYLVNATRWNYNDAFTREKLLGIIPQLLGTWGGTRGQELYPRF
jgi:AraC-like DNA-binding protein